MNMAYDWGLSDDLIADKKKLILKVIHESGAYNVTLAAEACGLNNIMVYQWRKADDEFRELMDNAIAEHRNAFVDMAEKTLKEAVERGDMTATIFSLKTLGRARGYEQSAKLTVDHNHNATMDLDEAARRIAFAMNTAGITTIEGSFTELLESPKLIESGVVVQQVEQPQLTAADTLKAMKESKAQVDAHRKKRAEERGKRISATKQAKKSAALAAITSKMKE